MSLFSGGGFVFLFAGVGFLGTVDAVGRVETWTEHFLLALTVATAHGLDYIVKAGFLVFLFHNTTVTTNTMPTIHILLGTHAKTLRR